MKQAILEFGKDHPILNNVRDVEELRKYLNKRLETETFEELQKSIQEDFFNTVQRLKSQSNSYNISMNTSVYDSPQTWFKEFNQLDREYYPILLDIPEWKVNEESSQPDVAVKKQPKISDSLFLFIETVLSEVKTTVNINVLNTLWDTFNEKGWDDPNLDRQSCINNFIQDFEYHVDLEKTMRVGSKITLLNGEVHEVEFFTKISGDKLKHPEADWFVKVKAYNRGFFFNNQGQEAPKNKFNPNNILSIE